jgi:hypothetical protein
VLSFIKFIKEDIDYNPLNMVASGPMPDGDGTETAYHTEIPSKKSNSGKTNLWLAKVTSNNGTDHFFHFGINDNISADVFKEKHKQLTDNSNQPIAPHQTFYSFGDTQTEQLGLEHHGPETMLHVVHHFENMANDIPVGHRIHIDPGEIPENTPETVKTIRNKKLHVYRKLAERVARKGNLKIVSNEDDPTIVLERL